MILISDDDRRLRPNPNSAAYTAAQAADGFATYQTNCASCHLPDLTGRNEAPQLAGGNFMNAWESRTTRELIRVTGLVFLRIYRT
jgi:mono/diheme cytochrome c family protein